jgi:thioredoxin 1
MSEALLREVVQESAGEAGACRRRVRRVRMLNPRPSKSRILLIGGKNSMSENPNVHAVSDSSFDGDILKSEQPVLVDFWAPWCGPCRSVAPIVDDLATLYLGKLKVAKINVDESSNVAMKYQVTSIPTFILFKNGEVADRVLGAIPRSEFVKFIDRNL